MDNRLHIFGGEKTITGNGKFKRPIITKDTEDAVLKQLHEDISIYDGGGIVGEFEKKFAGYHGREHAVAFNSGTTALLAMFEGLNLQPGDEILCPTYTFFATASPLAYMGVNVKFCDCKNDGNIDPQDIKRKISPKTKGIVITHMRGLPCDMNEIMEIAQEYDVPVLEDCSHAHGAEYKGKKVGTFGKAAVWSLQGKKIITGGEGGIMLTDDKEIYQRALLLGHYNKRCFKEIDSSSPYYEYNLTGFGLKLRPHPLGIAIANEQFSRIDDILKIKERYAHTLIECLKEFDCIHMPSYENKKPSRYGLNVQYDENNAYGLTKEIFLKLLHSEGLSEAESPDSTRPIHDLKLFNDFRADKKIIKSDEDDFTQAKKYHKNSIKFTLGGGEVDSELMNLYAQGLRKISSQIVSKADDIHKYFNL